MYSQQINIYTHIYIYICKDLFFSFNSITKFDGFTYIYIYIYDPRKNPRVWSLKLESSMSTGIDCIINLELKNTSKFGNKNTSKFACRAKYYLYKKKKKIQFSGVIINLFQVYDDPLQMVNYC